jgi:hypothetical protein
MIDFPDWISIIDLNEKKQVGGNTIDADIPTEVLQDKIKRIFDKIEKNNEYQDGGKRKLKKKSKKASQGNSLAMYNAVLWHIGDYMKLPKGVKALAPARAVLKKIQEMVLAKNPDLSKDKLYDMIKKTFDENPSKYV